ncbi:hypothetical protein BDA96_04G319000 [Sorghum bicolor]|uniref:Uncharacterized protein n=1 Tax=Sorghum bicolor TaxID=4558 RepID=A0A921R7R4_SORBI|nr:uncharacterized protein LOC110434318 isoform X2 [Sorghum bicolor]KAG0534890.1 hypothetical protein BDA96_04G319000 [Sorghum bicolor]|eukprot:XP_021313839.1 uncharacterized protein LOC110434318 isoform X2 [Sorghum bicolor]
MPSRSKELCVSSSRCWMKRRWEEKASSVSCRARASDRPDLFSPVLVAMDWQECTLQILEDKPDLSRWTLKYEVLGWDVEFSWLARNMTKTNWQSLQGLPNRFPHGRCHKD